MKLVELISQIIKSCLKYSKVFRKNGRGLASCRLVALQLTSAEACSSDEEVVRRKGEGSEFGVERVFLSLFARRMVFRILLS